MTDGDISAIDAGLAALLRRDWPAAADHYGRALAEEESAAALEGWATARWWLDDLDGAIGARERAYALRRRQGDDREAAYDAAFLAWDHGALRGGSAVANGWLQRARRLTRDLPPDGGQAWLPLIEASFHLDDDHHEVLRLATEGLETAHRLGVFDIEMTAQTLRGLALVSLGDVSEGMALLDEGAAAATSGELHDPIAIGSCCCNMIIACERARDFDRVADWCRQLEVFAERSGQRPLLALCRAHHGAMLVLRGEWDDADGELTWAAETLADLRPPVAGYARARLAGLRHRQGRDDEARALLDAAGTHSLVALGRATLAFDAGDLVGAGELAERYLRRLGDDEHHLDAAGALELLVPVRLAADEVAAGRAAHERLADLADRAGTESLRGAERHAAGQVAVVAGELAAARTAFEDAVDLFVASGEPFEAAKARLGLAEALVRLDRLSAAQAVASEAGASLDALGAAPAAQRAKALVERLGGGSGRRAPGPRSGLTRREVEVLALVADGCSNREIAERLVVSEHTVHRHVANVLTKLGVPSRAAAVAVAAELGLLR